MWKLFLSECSRVEFEGACEMSLNRREWLARTAFGMTGALAASASPLVRGLASGATPRGSEAKKVLFFTKSSGFQHSVVTRSGDGLAHAERILTEIGKANGFDVTCSKDGRLFEPDQIGEWDAFAFYTTGDLTKSGTDGQPPMSPKGEEAFYEAIQDGKGLIGMHCATDTFGHHRGRGADDPYIKLIGGEFSGHGAQQVAKLRVVDREFPGAAPFGAEFSINDEWYGQKNLADDLHVIIVQQTGGMQGRDYERPDYPQTWSRAQGKGRVFYTSMGHREDVWTNPNYQGLLIGALRWATGQVEGSTEPDVAKVTPGYRTLPG